MAIHHPVPLEWPSWIVPKAANVSGNEMATYRQLTLGGGLFPSWKFSHLYFFPLLSVLLKIK